MNCVLVRSCVVTLVFAVAATAQGQMTVTPYSAPIDYSVRPVDVGSVVSSLGGLTDGLYSVTFDGRITNGSAGRYVGLQFFVDGVAYAAAPESYNFMGQYFGQSEFTRTLQLSGGGVHTVQARVIDDNLGSASFYATALNALRHNIVGGSPTATAFGAPINYAVRSVDVGSVISSLSLSDGLYDVTFDGRILNATPGQYLGVRLFVDGVQYSQAPESYVFLDQSFGQSEFTRTLQLSGGGTHTVELRVIDDQLGAGSVYATALNSVRHNVIGGEPTATLFSAPIDYSLRAVNVGSVVASLNLADGDYVVTFDGRIASATAGQYLGVRFYVDGVLYAGAPENYTFLGQSFGQSEFSRTLQLSGGGTHSVEVRVIDDQLGSGMVYATALNAVGFNPVAVPEPSALALLGMGALGLGLYRVGSRKRDGVRCTPG